MKKEFLFSNLILKRLMILIVFFLALSFVFAFDFEDRSYGLGKKPLALADINYSLVPTVNSSDWWDDVNTPNDFISVTTSTLHFDDARNLIWDDGGDELRISSWTDVIISAGLGGGIYTFGTSELDLGDDNIITTGFVNASNIYSTDDGHFEGDITAGGTINEIGIDGSTNSQVLLNLPASGQFIFNNPIQGTIWSITDHATAGIGLTVSGDTELNQPLLTTSNVTHHNMALTGNVTATGNITTGKEIRINSATRTTAFPYEGAFFFSEGSMLLEQSTPDARMLYLPNGDKFEVLTEDGSKYMAQINYNDIAFYRGSSVKAVIIDAALTRAIVSAQADSMTLGAVPTGFSILSTGNNYGMNFGLSSSGYGWVQQGRISGGATAYDLYLQPEGGQVITGDLNVTGIIYNDAIYCESSDLNDQTFAVAGVPYRLNISNTDEGNGIGMETGNNGTNVTILTDGVYHMVAQPQVKAGAGGAGDFHMWIEKAAGGNHVFANIPDSNIELKLSSLEEDVIVLATTLKLDQGDILRFVSSVSDIKIILHTQSPAGEPVIPSIIFTMYRIGS